MNSAAMASFESAAELPDDDRCDDDRFWEDDNHELCECGRDVGSDVGSDTCGQCGIPLCHMCFETGVGFCSVHPDRHYQPEEHDEIQHPT